MKYTYKDKKIHKIKHKLKLLLTILFAALIATTGYILSKNVLSDPSPYGTATITFNSGSAGHFEDGTSTNVVTYNLVKKETRYSHTPNVLDDGTQNGNYANNLNLNDVVTISGASSLHVVIIYGGESASYDWACVWEGSHSDYTASGNYSSSVSGKLGGGSHSNASNRKEYDITGNSVTFGFKSDVSGYGDGYGYYAVITGETSDGQLGLGSIVSGEYKVPIPYDSDYKFDTWSINLSQISTSTTTTASYVLALISSGTYDGVDWRLFEDGRLIIGKTGQTQTFSNNTYRTATAFPWYNNGSVKSIKFEGTVVGKGSHTGMFYALYNLKSFDGTGFNTSQITSMDEMFGSCSSLTSLDLSMFNTNNVTKMYKMFNGCTSLTSLDVSSFNTTNITNMTHMFHGCKIANLDLSSFNTTNVTNMSYMFQNYGTSSSDTTFLTQLNTSNVVDMQYMFSGCGITELDLSTFNTSKVTNMQYMFSGAGIISIDLSSFNTTKVTTMNSMFYNCTNLISLDLTSFSTSSVTNMASMFKHCFALTSLTFSNNFNTGNVTNMQYMFYSLRSLTSLDVSMFNTSKVTTMEYMFAGTGIINLDLSSFNTVNVTNMHYMFSGYAATSTNGGSTSYDTFSSLESINLSSFNTAKVTNMGGMFLGCHALESIDVSSFNTTNVTYMNDMFQSCYVLTEINVSNFNTTNTTDMDEMFSYCKAIEELDLTSFNTTNVTDMSSMFQGCLKLTSLNISSFNTSNVTNMNYIFSNTDSLGVLKLGTNWNFLTNTGLTKTWVRDGDATAHEYTATELIANYNGATMAGTYRTVPLAYAEFDSSNGQLRIFKTASTTYTNGQVIGTKTYYAGIEDITGTNYPKWYSKRSNITSVIIEGEFKPKTAHGMFMGCSNLTTITGIEYLDTSNVTDMGYMFYNCSSLTSLDVSGFDTNNVTNSIYMFNDCNSLTSLDVTSFDTTNITDMTGMFSGCSSLTSLDVSGFDTSNATDMTNMFGDCSSLISLDLSDFNTSNVTNMSLMLSGCSSLTSLDLSNFNTSNVTDMSFMFSEDNNLESLDLSSFNTANVENMDFIFSNTTRLSILKLGTTWNFVPAPVNGLTKSWKRDGNNTIYTASQLINTYNGSTMAGTYRAVQQLTITEQVKGSIANVNKNFDFTINVKIDGVGINTTHAYTGSKTGNLVFSNGNATFTLKHGESISIYFPYDVSYTITQNSDGYTLAKTNDTGTLDSDKTASFIDTLEETTPTGIFLDLIPFILLITFGIFGIFLIRKFRYI